MYFIKTKGTNKVPDYVQIRDKDFALIEHIKMSVLEKKLKKFFPKKYNSLYLEIEKEPFGKIIEHFNI